MPETTRQMLGNMLAAALDGGGIGGLLSENSEARKRIADYKPPPPDPRQEFEREARKRFNAALDDGLARAGADGGSVTVRKTATAAELETESAERARQKAEREASVAREQKLTADAAALQAQIEATEKNIRAAERRELGRLAAARREAVDQEMQRIASDRERRGKKPLDTNRLRSRAALNVAKGER